jgi:hypothetical protein
MGIARIVRCAAVIAAMVPGSPIARAQEVDLVTRVEAVDASWVAVHNLQLVRNGRIDSVVSKVVREETAIVPKAARKKGQSQFQTTEHDLTAEVVSAPFHEVPLMNGDSVVFISGSYQDNGKQARITRAFRVDSRQIRKGANGERLISDGIYVGNREDIAVTKRFTIGRDGELSMSLASVSRGDVDLMPAILSGECKSLTFDERIMKSVLHGSVQFHVGVAGEGAPVVTLTCEGDSVQSLCKPAKPLIRTR